ncbi:MAG: FkbM family methyltransferase [Planctomycetota bacterium]
MPSHPVRLFRSLRTRGPLQTWRLVADKARRVDALNPWFLDPRRIATRRFVHRHLQPFDRKLTSFGNYWLDPKPLGEDAVVYSCGVGSQIDFDLAVAARVGCQVHLFDPTPRSIAFMKRFADHQMLHFTPVGVWTANGDASFHFDAVAGRTQDVGNASITNLFDRPETFTAPVKTLRTLMQERGHTQLDVLKMDIEGAALDVLEQALADGIWPGQLVLELERPRRWKSIRTYFARVRELLERLAAEGYEVVRTPRDHGPYRSIELLARRRTPAPRSDAAAATATRAEAAVDIAAGAV